MGLTGKLCKPITMHLFKKFKEEKIMKATVYLNRLEELKKVYNKFAKKANNAGLETSLTVGEPYVKEIDVYRYDEINHCEYKDGKMAVDVVDIELVYPDYKLGNYTVAAVIDHTVDKLENAVYPYGEIEVPKIYFKGQGKCDHCGTNHKRNKTILLIDPDGNYKQVGTSCIKEYTRISDYSLIGNFMVFESIFIESDIYRGSFCGVPTEKMKTVEYLASCIHMIRKEGYNKGIKENAFSNKAVECITKSDTETAEKVIEYFKNLETTDNFLHNVKLFLQKAYNEESGFIAYAYMSYQKELEKIENAKKQQAENELTEYYGKVGDKIEVEVTGKVVYSYSIRVSYYNFVDNYIYEFRDNLNHVFIWKTSKVLDTNDDGIFTGTIKGTIKELNEYNGKKQTVLTRVKAV